jgi:alkaline phosphatase D
MANIEINITTMKKALLSAILMLILFPICFAQKIVSGPMAGYATMLEVGLWVQIDAEADVQIEYWKEGSTTKAQSEIYHTTKNEAFTARFKVGELEPGTNYNYQVLINGKSSSSVLNFTSQTLWQYRTDPPAFKMAIGSCTYINEERYDRPGTPYGKSYAIFDNIANMNPDMTLWLGDNIYLRETDWNSWTGYLHRYSHTRSIPEMQKLLQTGHHYAIWDDHDFGPNDADGSWLHKDWAMKSFELFWMNPSVGVPGLDGNISAFEFNDVDFFLLDNRYNRKPYNQKNEAPAMLGKAQIDWLVDMLKFSRSPFKMVAVGGQIINDVAIYENFAQFKEEREYLLHRIEEEGIKGVIFLTGDRHHTELSKMTLANGVDIYDLTVSPLSSGAHDAEKEGNSFRVDGTFLATQNFAIAEVTGARKSRLMTITIYDSKGEMIWMQELKGAY